MIIENGHIRIKVKAEPQVTEDGYFKKPDKEQWLSPIPCQWILTAGNNNEMVNGEHYKSASYTILIEQGPQLHIGEQLMLEDFLCTCLGEFSIISVEPLDAVGQLKIRI